MKGAGVRTIGAALWIVGICWSGVAAAADPLPPPTGPVLLVLSGAIEQTNAPGEARFDREMLRGLGIATIRTTTPWTEGVKSFEGVPLEAVLNRVGAHGTMLDASALNDYRVTIPVEDLSYGIILAMSVDGAMLSRRARGPLWVIYPREGMGLTESYRTEARSIWQVSRVVVR
jgi:hypothetical protein